MSNLSKTVLEHKGILDSYRGVAEFSPDFVISEAYSFMKAIAKEYYKGHKMSEYYDTLVKSLVSLEDLCFRNQRIVDVPIAFNSSKVPNKDNVIEYLVWRVRNHLLRFIGSEDLSSCDMRNQCIRATQKVNKVCKELGIKCKTFVIYPAFDSKNRVESDFIKHQFNIITFGSKSYLVDITYSQFFEKKNNNLERLGIVNLSGTNVGSYMLRNEKSVDLAVRLFKYGYVELTGEALKIYLDGFTLSFRNGLFYENSEKGYITPYNIDDYIRFLSGKDSQVEHEKIKYLGKQKMPLSDSSFNFKK